MTNYERIEKAIVYLKGNFQDQPSLEDVASQVHLSSFHFQKLFKDWAGVSPKKFIQFLSVEYAKSLLKQQLTIADVSYETGLSGTSRLHDLFIGIEGMTPGEYKNGGEALEIHYSFAETPFGDIIIASTEKGICHLSFVNDQAQGIEQLKTAFPKASIQQKTDIIQQDALAFFRWRLERSEKSKTAFKGNSIPVERSGKACSRFPRAT
jgi:AraC family transcriptional regulator of adaptative response/methylated-DNA-[protein]-cysteine methyltransferase